MKSQEMNHPTKSDVHVLGNCCLGEALKSKQMFEAELAVNPNLTLDLSQTFEFDSSCVGMLLILKRRAQESGGVLVLKNPSDAVLRLFNTLNLSKIFWMDTSP